MTTFLKNGSVSKLFDLLEEPAYRILSAYLREYAWNDEAKRLIESRFVGVGSYRLLTNISIKYQNGSIENLIAFYEQCKRPKDEPHYEDLIITIFINIITGIIANHCYDFLKNHAKDIKELTNQLRNKYGRSLDYIIRAKWLREMLHTKNISKEEHDFLLQYLKLKYLTPAPVDNVDSKILMKMESEFQKIAKCYGISLTDMPTSLIGKLIDFTSKQSLFNWDEIPGNDSGRFIEFLRQNYTISWVKTAKIYIIDNGGTINVSTENNSLSLRLDNDKSRAILTIDDGRTDEFIAKIENGKLNIYIELNTKILKELDSLLKKSGG